MALHLKRAPYDYRLEVVSASDFACPPKQAQELLFSVLQLPQPKNLEPITVTTNFNGQNDLHEFTDRGSLESQLGHVPAQASPDKVAGSSHEPVAAGSVVNVHEPKISPVSVVPAPPKPFVSRANPFWWSPLQPLEAPENYKFRAELDANQRSLKVAEQPPPQAPNHQLSRKRKRIIQNDTFDAKWQKLEEIPSGLEIVTKRPNYFYQFRALALLSPADSVGLDVWPHNTNTTKIDLRFSDFAECLPADAPMPTSYNFRIYEALGDACVDPRRPPEPYQRKLVSAIQVDVLPQEGLPRWRPENPNHFATLALPSGQYIWSQVYHTYGAQYGRQLWGSVEFSSMRGFGTKVYLDAEFPIWFTSCVRPELITAPPVPLLRASAFGEMTQPGNFLLHSLATTPYVDVAKAWLRSNAGANAAEFVGTSGVTALHLAAWRGPPQMVDFLCLAAPEALFIKDENGNTPFDVAVHHARAHIFDLLMDRLLDQLNPNCGDYAWANHVVENVIPTLGAETLYTKPVGWVVSHFCQTWWPRQYARINQLIPSITPMVLQQPIFSPSPPKEGALVPLPAPVASDEPWYRPAPPQASSERNLSPSMPTYQQPIIRSINRPAPVSQPIAHAPAPSSSRTVTTARNLLHARLLEQEMLSDDANDEDKEDSYDNRLLPDPTEHIIQRPKPAQRFISIPKQPSQLASYDGDAAESIGPEDYARGYWIELATNTGEDPATKAAADLNGRCGKAIDDFNPPYKVVVRILDFKAAVADLDNLRAALEVEILQNHVQLLEFVNPVIKRREATSKLLQPLLGSAKASRSNGMMSYAIPDLERRRIEVYKVRYAYTQASYFPHHYFQLLCPLATFPLSDDFDVTSPIVEEICNNPSRKEHLQVDHWWVRVKPKTEMKSKKTAAIPTPPPPRTEHGDTNIRPVPIKNNIGKRSFMPPIRLQPNIILRADGYDEQDVEMIEMSAPPGERAVSTSYPPPASRKVPPEPSSTSSTILEAAVSPRSDGRSKRSTAVTNYAVMHNGSYPRSETFEGLKYKLKPTQSRSNHKNNFMSLPQPTRRSGRPPKPTRRSISSESSSSSEEIDDRKLDMEDEAALALLGLPFNGSS